MVLGILYLNWVDLKLIRIIKFFNIVGSDMQKNFESTSKRKLLMASSENSG